MKRVIKAGMTVDEVSDAILRGKPFDLSSLDEYNDYYHSEGAIRASEVREGQVIQNTEDADELDLNEVFEVLRIRPHSYGWEEFDYTFTVRVLSLTGNPIYDIHYMKDEYVGVPLER